LSASISSSTCQIRPPATTILSKAAALCIVMPAGHRVPLADGLMSQTVHGCIDLDQKARPGASARRRSRSGSGSSRACTGARECSARIKAGAGGSGRATGRIEAGAAPQPKHRWERARRNAPIPRR
jgi:hypothetical protein